LMSQLTLGKFEIQLFWSRSLFFWGFIASAFVGYATLQQHGSDLSVVVACFGVVCSVAWTLVNRGSKYWQEAWEQKVERLESGVTGALFSQEETEIFAKSCWLRGRRYSVSKLAIGLSDYTVLFWLCITTRATAAVFASDHLRLVQAIRAPIIRFRLGRLRGDATGLWRFFQGYKTQHLVPRHRSPRSPLTITR
jgi:hypothetical protein